MNTFTLSTAPNFPHSASTSSSSSTLKFKSPNISSSVNMCLMITVVFFLSLVSSKPPHPSSASCLAMAAALRFLPPWRFLATKSPFISNFAAVTVMLVPIVCLNGAPSRMVHASWTLGSLR